jgi:hypothetical protein
VITLLHNLEGALGVDQLNIWANEFGLNHPIVGDQDYVLSDALWPDNPRRPEALLLGPGAEVLIFSPSEEQIAELIAN